MTADRDNLERLRGAGWVLGMMADRLQMQVMADRLDSERLMGFDNRQMDGQTDRHFQLQSRFRD